ncbi:hypothetical protein ABAC460_06975 [Asticcacaulis sp. AC460]|uniref:type II toxin-antitoxin system PemK/MazF family toxin n=1 Tax=Asticcacaulis sp. AC460 TaxID=1282360 RepID=UPI0003C3D931|nr:type II toxin-antitoxin system PemK/MazF family toxin [Asticcacaulis sp. AC460]ESQ91302.1 hypothetical protein ABAC460_06975 [Asticcacaulis sp. AC460]
MALPDPKPGLVINYSYLWQEEATKGQDEGRKDRPCVIILAVQQIEGEQVVTVAPITHSPPAVATSAIELPAPVKRHLGLDDQRSWIVTSEVNRFAWPGSDLRPVSRNKPGQFTFGFIPGDLIRKIRQQIQERRSIKITDRDA